MTKMTEAEHKVISVDYKLTKDTEKGDLIETSEGKEPLVFLSGLGHMIPTFEQNVLNLNVGDNFSFGIKAADAYGVRNEQAVVDLAQDMFMKEGKLMEEIQIGATVPLQDQEGRVHPAKVMSVNEETVTMDVNHPLADQDLHFTGKVIGTRAATEDEVSHGHVHGEGGHNH
jgi:FKBP-type peptidyl-prolyl cis-trans isomerase SlyD